MHFFNDICDPPEHPDNPERSTEFLFNFFGCKRLPSDQVDRFLSSEHPAKQIHNRGYLLLRRSRDDDLLVLLNDGLEALLF